MSETPVDETTPTEPTTPVEEPTMSETPTAPIDGISLEKVGIALTGKAAIVEVSDTITLPTATEFEAASLTLPAGFRGLGLRTEDGAPEWADEPDGDPLKFFEDGWEIPTGQVTSTCTMILAQTDPFVIELKTGTTLSAGGSGEIDLGGNAKRYFLYTEEVYKTGGEQKLIERRLAEVTVQKVTAQKPERGTNRGWEVVFSNHRSDKFGGKHMLYAQLAG